MFIPKYLIICCMYDFIEGDIKLIAKLKGSKHYYEHINKGV